MRAPIVHCIADILFFETLLVAQVDVVVSHLGGFLLGAIVGRVLILRQTPEKPRHGVFLVVCLMALFLRAGVLALAIQRWGWPVQTGIIPAAVASALVVYWGAGLLQRYTQTSSRWSRRRAIAIGLIIYLFILRLVYLGVPGLIPEEAYYWNYAQHLDWGYLDHPPMVAWMIAAGTAIFGHSEVGVRAGSLASWLVMLTFGVLLARDLYGRRAAIFTALLLSALPYFFGVGILATPDVFVTTASAGALFYLARALLRGGQGSWFGVGVCLGLGLLSKYTIVLLIPSALAFMLFDPGARRWLRSPWPYVALGLACLIFFPVIVWNARHDWVSFAFQTSRRLQEASRFSLHVLLGDLLFLLTPTGLLAAVTIIRRKVDLASPADDDPVDAARRRRFLFCFLLVPVGIITLFSLTHEPKLNWTGPSWLVVLPAVAGLMTGAPATSPRGFIARLQRMWMPTIVTCVLLYGILFHYLVLGFPAVPYPGFVGDIAGWRQLREKLAAVESALELRAGSRPLMVGMDRYNIASELAFYADSGGARQTAGRSLFGQSDLMYQYWFPKSKQDGKNMLLVARDSVALNLPAVATSFDSLEAIAEVPVTLNGQSLRRYFYRLGCGYKSGEPAPDSSGRR